MGRRVFTWLRALHLTGVRQLGAPPWPV